MTDFFSIPLRLEKRDRESFPVICLIALDSHVLDLKTIDLGFKDRREHPVPPYNGA